MTAKKTAALRALQGNAGKRPIKNTEVIASIGAPEPPAWLGDKEKEAFGMFAQQVAQMKGVLTLQDQTALAMLANDWVALQRYSKALEAGATYEHKELRKPLPEAALYNETAGRLAQMLKQFGLTPASRSKLQVQPQKEKPSNPFAERFKKQ